MSARIGPDPNYRRRYPGAPPFADLPLHRKLFFGRGADARNLVDTILAESLVVVYARSGSGKTSLINVAVKEKLREEGYAPLVVRIGKHGQNPLQAVFQGMAQSAEDQAFEHHTKTTASLWHYFKTVEFWRGDTLLKPVLVVDQFEELFTLHTQAERQEFVRALAHLLRGPAPKLDQALPPEVGELTETPPPVKVVLSMREDFLAMLDELVPDLPNILAARFRLSPMDRGQAKQAIEGPASVEDEALEAPTFTFTEGTVQKMIDFLAEGVGPDLMDAGGINPFQIQIVCQHVEDLVLARTTRAARPSTGPVSISYEDLGGATGLRETVSQFYERQLNNFNPYLRRRIQRLCEDGLVNREGRRIAQEQSEIVNRFGVDTRTLGRLVDLRLLQRERRLGGNHYELSHDTLLHPVLQARRRRRQRWRIVRLSAAIAVLAMALLATIWMLQRSAIRREVADYVGRSYQSEDDSENRLIHALAAVTRSLSVTNLDPRALQALFDAEQVPTVFKRPLTGVKNAALSPDGQLVALAKGGEIELQHPVDQGFSRPLRPAFAEPVSVLVFAPQGDRIAAAAGREIRVWDVAGREVGSVTAAAPVNAIAFDPLMQGPGLAIATTAGGWSQIVGDPQKWAIGTPVDPSRDELKTLTFSPNGAWLIGASAGATAHAWTRKGAFVRTIQVDAGLRKWTLWPDPATGHKWLGVIAGSRVTVINADDSSATRQVLTLQDSGGTGLGSTGTDAETDSRPAEIAFSPDGRYLAIGTMNGDTQVFSRTATHSLKKDGTDQFWFLARFGSQSQKPIRGLSWSPTDHHLLIMQEDASILRPIVAAAPAGTASGRVDVASELRMAAVSRPLYALDGGGAVVTDFMDDWVRVLRPPNGLVQTGVYNPRVLPLGRGYVFASEEPLQFCVELWEDVDQKAQTPPPGAEERRIDCDQPTRRMRWQAARTTEGALRAVARTSSAFLVVTTDLVGRLRLYSGDSAGGKLAEVAITNLPPTEVAHVVAEPAGTFLLMSVDGAIARLSVTGSTGSIKELQRVGEVPNVLFDRRGRLITWLQSGLPKRWELRDPTAPETARSSSSVLQDASIQNRTKIVAMQAVVSMPDDVFAVADDAGDVHVVEAFDGGVELRPRLVIKARVGEVRQLASSPTTVALIAGDADKNLSLVHIRRRADAVARFAGSAIAIGDRGRFVAMLKPDKVNPVIRLSGADLRETLTVGLGARCHPTAIAASPASEVLIVGCLEGLMAALTPTGEGLPHPAPAFEPAPAVCRFEPTSPGDPTEATVVALAFAPSGQFFAGASRHKVAVWDANGSLRVTATAPKFEAKDDWITSIAVSPSDVIAVGTAKGLLMLMTVNGKVLSDRGSPLQARTAVTAIAFSPDGRQIAAGYDNGTIQPYSRPWWSSRYSATPAYLKADARIVSLAFNPDGQRLASGAGNGEVRLWSSTYEPIAATRSLSSSPAAVAFSPDGLRLISSHDSLIETATPVPTDAWISEACSRLAWSQRLRDNAGDPVLNIVRDACQSSWDARRSTSLVDAAAAGDIDVVEALLKTADVNATDDIGRSPLMRALAKGNIAVAQLILAKNPDLTRRDSLGAGVLHYAAEADARSILPSLLGAGLPVDRTDQNGRTPLMIAAARGHRALAQILIDHKADPNVVDEVGRTALINASEGNHLELITLLRKAGGDVNARERMRLSFGKTVGQLASVEGERLLVEESAGLTSIVTNPTPNILLRLPLNRLASNDAQRVRAERLITWRRGGMSAADADALMRDLSAAVTNAGAKPNPGDLVLLGLARGFGVDGRPDWKAARTEFDRAAGLNSKLAATLASVIMLEGLDGTQAFAEAIQRLKIAARTPGPDPLGAWLLAVLHRDRYVLGDTGNREKDTREFLDFATGAPGPPFGPAWNSQAFIAFSEPSRIERELECAAAVRTSLENASTKAEDVVAASNLADWLWNAGDAKAMDQVRAAVDLAPKSLSLSLKPIRLEYLALFRLGFSHEYGVGPDRSDVKVLKWGQARDYAQALKYFTDSADGGNSEANRELGRMYELGLGVEASLAKAVTHYRRGAAGGDLYSRNRLNALGFSY